MSRMPPYTASSAPSAVAGETEPGMPGLVSIIMPAYNTAAYITRAVESVLAQTHTHWELIIVDDASTDQTAAVLEPYLSDPRIQYYAIARIGHPAGVRNAGLHLARGEYIAFLDSDDLYLPTALSRLLITLQHNPRLFAAYGFAQWMDAEENPLPANITLIPNYHTTDAEAPPYQWPAGYSHSWENILTSHISCLLSALMLRRDAQRQIGFFNEQLSGAEDYEYYVRLFLHDYDGVAAVSDYIYRYRIHASSLTKAPQHTQKLLESCREILRWIFDESSLPQPYHALRSHAYTACYRYLARERILNAQPDLGRAILWQAFCEPVIHKPDFIRACLPLWLRSFLPAELNRQLANLKQCVRVNKQAQDTDLPNAAADSNQWKERCA